MYMYTVTVCSFNFIHFSNQDQELDSKRQDRDNDQDFESTGLKSRENSKPAYPNVTTTYMYAYYCVFG